MRPAPAGRALLFLAVFALYAPSARFEFIHDDRQLILRQPAPRSVGDVAAVFAQPHWPGLPYYRPVTRATMVVQKALHGDDPAPFHLFNAALMGVAALLTCAILRRRPFGVEPVPALLAGALFAMHPIASGTVYPVCSGRETLVPAVLMLGALHAWLHPGRRWHAAAVGLTGLALFAKEMAAVLPVVFALADALALSPDPPGRSASRWLRRYAPFAVLFVAYFAIRSHVLGATLHPIALLDRPLYPLLTAVYALQTTFAPFGELVYEPRWPVWWSAPRTAVWILGLAALAVVARRQRVSRAVVLFWCGWWVVTQLPTANILVQESPFAERYGFLALLAPTAVAAAAASAAWRRPASRRAIAAGGAVAIAACAAITFLRGAHFANEFDFAAQWVRTDPGSYKAQLNMGQGFVERGMWEEAAEHLGEAARLRPGSAVIQNGLAYALLRKGDLERAAEHFRRAIRIAPELAIARTNYADLLARRGELDPAIAHYQRAVQLSPADARTHRQLARALRRRGRPGDAELAARHLRRALSLDPGSARTHLELGEVLEQLQDVAGAAQHYEAALRLRPGLKSARRRLRALGSPRADDGDAG